MRWAVRVAVQAFEMTLVMPLHHHDDNSSNSSHNPP
jgi:hypothetical protein